MSKIKARSAVRARIFLALNKKNGRTLYSSSQVLNELRRHHSLDLETLIKQKFLLKVSALLAQVGVFYWFCVLYLDGKSISLGWGSGKTDPPSAGGRESCWLCLRL